MTLEEKCYLIRLERAARQAFHLWGRTCRALGYAETDFIPDLEEVERLTTWNGTRAARFQKLKRALACRLNCSEFSVYNAIAQRRQLPGLEVYL